MSKYLISLEYGSGYKKIINSILKKAIELINRDQHNINERSLMDTLVKQHFSDNIKIPVVRIVLMNIKLNRIKNCLFN